MTCAELQGAKLRSKTLQARVRNASGGEARTTLALLFFRGRGSGGGGDGDAIPSMPGCSEDPCCRAAEWRRRCGSRASQSAVVVGEGEHLLAERPAAMHCRAGEGRTTEAQHVFGIRVTFLSFSLPNECRIHTTYNAHPLNRDSARRRTEERCRSEARTASCFWSRLGRCLTSRISLDDWLDTHSNKSRILLLTGVLPIPRANAETSTTPPDTLPL